MSDLKEDGKASNGVGIGGDSLKLPDIIQERKMDNKAKRKLEAEQKRLTNLQRIRDMKSTTGIDPLQRFPKEIWAKIFDDLDPADLGNMWQVHPIFRDLMESIRIRDILFPLVLEVNTFQRCMKKIFTNEFNQELRLISKSSRNSFDCRMENKLSERIQDMEVPFDLYQEDFVISLHIENDDALEMLKSLLGSFNEGENPGKRFFPRGLSISFSEYHVEFEDDDEEVKQERLEIRNRFQKDVTTLLQRIGDQIWWLRFYLHDLKTPPFSFSEAYMLFHDWITLMPNLKWLEYCIDGSKEIIHAEELETSVGSDLLRKTPFPHLPFLERLTLTFHFAAGQMEIFEAVLAANQHVKFLEFVDGDDSELQHLPTHLIKSLNLDSISVVHQDSYGRSLRWIQPLINFNWQLKTISLVLELAGMKVDSVFRFLEKFPTLEKVDLSQLHGVLIGGGDTLGYLELPNLKSFDVQLHDPVIDYESNIHFFLSLQFLLHCKYLETLYWNWNAHNVDEMKIRRHLKKHEIPGETIDFRAGLRFVYESNIWDVFPNLSTVIVCAKKGDRERAGRVSRSHSSCSHEYRRLKVGEKVSVGQFVARHKCCRNDNLDNCVVLAK